MNRQDLFEWMDVLAAAAFNSSEPLEDRLEYARWWIELAEWMTLDTFLN
jgi:hypothetical protein